MVSSLQQWSERGLLLEGHSLPGDRRRDAWGHGDCPALPITRGTAGGGSGAGCRVTEARREVSPFIGRVVSLSPVFPLRCGSGCLCSVTPRSPARPEKIWVIFSPVYLSCTSRPGKKRHFLCKGSFLLPCRITSALRGAAQHLSAGGVLWGQPGILWGRAGIRKNRCNVVSPPSPAPICRTQNVRAAGCGISAGPAWVFLHSLHSQTA